MNIIFTPQRRDDSLTLNKQGDMLIICGTAYDFSTIPEGATLPASATDCPFLLGNIERISGVLRLSMILPVGVNATQAASFPAPIINAPDGALDLPK